MYDEAMYGEGSIWGQSFEGDPASLPGRATKVCDYLKLILLVGK